MYISLTVSAFHSNNNNINFTDKITKTFIEIFNSKNFIAMKIGMMIFLFKVEIFWHALSIFMDVLTSSPRRRVLFENSYHKGNLPLYYKERETKTIW